MLPFGAGLHVADARITGRRIDNSVAHNVVPPTGAAVGELAMVVCYFGTSSISGGSGGAWNSFHPTGTNFRVFWRLWGANDFTVALVLSADSPYACASVFGARSVVLGVEDQFPSTPGLTGTFAPYNRAGGCVGFIAFWQASASAIQFNPPFVGQSMDHTNGTYFLSSTISTDITQIQDGVPLHVITNTPSDTRYAGVYQLLAF